MIRLLFFPVAGVIALLQSLPLGFVAWLGRRGGDVAWYLDWHHRRQALVNLDIAFGESLSRKERERIARLNFRLLGEAFLCAIKIADLERGELGGRLQVAGLSKIRPWIERSEVPGVVIATGHFGNIEAYDFAAREVQWMAAATVYRPSPSPLMQRVMKRVRLNCRCQFFAEHEAAELRAFLRSGNVILGLMADFNPGPAGIRIPLFGKPAATSAAPAIQALRHRMPLHAAVCFRTHPARWRVEISDEIPTWVNGKPRPMEAILTDLNRHFEDNIRRDPANWFWAQPRWEHAGRVRCRT